MLTDGSTTDVVANNTATSLGTYTTGGVLEAEGFQAIAMQGSGGANAPNLVFRLDLTGQPAPTFAFNARDIDDQAADAVQPIAVQYRVGTSGAYTNLPAGFVADASAAGATTVTPVSVTLPGATAGAADVFVRVLTTDAVGSDELIGIDGVSITVGAGPSPLSLTSPGSQTSTQGVSIGTLQLAASGGTPPLTYGATGLPPGLSINTTNGQITGTPNTTVGSPFAVEVSVTDNAAVPATDTENFTWTVNPPLSVTAIKDIQGTGSSSPMSGQLWPPRAW